MDDDKVVVVEQAIERELLFLFQHGRWPKGNGRPVPPTWAERVAKVIGAPAPDVKAFAERLGVYTAANPRLAGPPPASQEHGALARSVRATIVNILQANGYVVPTPTTKSADAPPQKERHRFDMIELD